MSRVKGGSYMHGKRFVLSSTGKILVFVKDVSIVPDLPQIIAQEQSSLSKFIDNIPNKVEAIVCAGIRTDFLQKNLVTIQAKRRNIKLVKFPVNDGQALQEIEKILDPVGYVERQKSQSGYLEDIDKKRQAQHFANWKKTYKPPPRTGQPMVTKQVHSEADFVNATMGSKKSFKA